MYDLFLSIMTRVWRYLWISLAVLFALLFITLLFITQIDANRYKSVIETQVSDITGRQLRIDGALSINFGLQPQLSIEHISFANAPWGKQSKMLNLDLLQLKIQLMPLLKNKLVVDSLILDGLYLSIETNTDGKSNWQFEKLANDASDEPEPDEDGEPFELPILPILKQVDLDATQIYYSDATTDVKIDTIVNQLDLNNQGSNDSIHISAHGSVNQHPYRINGETHFLSKVTRKNLTEQGISLRLTANILDISLVIDGQIENPGKAKGIDIDLALDAKDLDKSFNAATGQSIHQYLQDTGQPITLSLATKLTDTSNGYRLKELNLRFIDNDISGDVSFADNQGRYEISANMLSDTININHFIVDRKDGSPDNHKNVNQTATSDTSEPLIDLPESILPFERLKLLDASLNYHIKQFQFDTLKPQNIIIDASLEDGVLDVSHFDLSLDSAPISSTLKIDASNDQPAINASLKTTGLKLEPLLNQFQLSQIQADTLNADVNLDTSGQSIKSLAFNISGNMNIQLDENDIAGNFSIINNPKRPKLIASLHSEGIDLNRLLPKVDQKSHHDENPDAARKKTAAKSKTGPKSIIELPDEPLPFDRLKTLDADLNIALKSFRYDNFLSKEVHTELTLNDGQLEIKAFNFKLDEHPIVSNMIVDASTGTPRIKAGLEIDRLQLNSISQLLGIEQLKSGTIQTKTKLNTRGNNIKTLIMSLNGKSVTQLVDVSLETSANDELRKIDIQQLDLNFSGMSKSLSYELDGAIDETPLALSGYIDSPAAILKNSNFSLKSDISALNAKLKVEGSIANTTALKDSKMGFSLNVPSIKATNHAISRLMPDVKPVEQVADLPLTISGNLMTAHGTYRINNLAFYIGGNDLKGNLFADLRNEKPYFAAKLTSELTDLNEIFPGTKIEDTETTDTAVTEREKKSANGKKKSDKLFSSEPFPALNVLDQYNVDLDYRLKKLISNKQTVDNIIVSLKLQDGKLTLYPFSIDFSQGTLRTNLSLSKQEKLYLRLNQKITKLNYGNLLTILGEKQYARGKLDAQATLLGSGDSMHELMSSLDGKVRVTTVNGELDNDSLKFLSKDVASLIPFTDTSDRQKIKCGVVQFNIQDGIASTHSMVLNTGAISVLGTGDINLANEDYSLYVAPRAKRTSLIQLAMVPVNISGPLIAPKVQPDITGSTISTTRTYANVSLTIMTGGLWLLAEGQTSKLWNKFVDNTDYCEKALAGEKIVPTRITFDADEEDDSEDNKDIFDDLDDDENDYM